MGWEAGSMACPRSWPWSSCFSSRKSLFMNLLLKLNRSELFIAIGETMDCARHFHAHLQEVLRGPLTLPCARTGCTLSAPPRGAPALQEGAPRLSGTVTGFTQCRGPVSLPVGGTLLVRDRSCTLATFASCWALSIYKHEASHTPLCSLFRSRRPASLRLKCSYVVAVLELGCVLDACPGVALETCCPADSSVSV